MRYNIVCRALREKTTLQNISLNPPFVRKISYNFSQLFAGWLYHGFHTNRKKLSKPKVVHAEDITFTELANSR